METGSAREPRAGRSEAEGERRVLDDLRRLRALLELLQLRQRQLRSRIAACEELQAEMAALRAALRASPERGAGA